MPKILENVKDDILNAARDMVLVEDLKNISMRELASRCNISIGTLYNYFDSKQDIIISIAWQEWYFSLNRMDCHNKTTIDYMEKLKFIFLELSNFLNIVHNIHHDNYFDTVGIEKIMKMRIDKKNIYEVLATKISDALSEADIPQQDPLVYSIIIRLYCAYALSDEITFEDLKPHIEKLIH